MMNILDIILIYLFEFDFELIQNQIQINKGLEEIFNRFAKIG
jgi:hypothetical protein